VIWKTEVETMQKCGMGWIYCGGAP